MKYYIPKYQKPSSPLVNKLIEDEEFFNAYTKFKETLPDNLRFGNPTDFNMYRYWELNGKPKNFEEGLNRKMFTFDNKDKKYHASSVAYNKDNNSYEIMKSKNHPTLDLEFQDYTNNAEFRKKYKYDGESHSYVRRTEPYSPYIKDYPKPKKVESFKPKQPESNELTAEDKNILWRERDRMGADRDGIDEYIKYWEFEKGGKDLSYYFDEYLNGQGAERIINNQQKLNNSDSENLKYIQKQVDNALMRNPRVYYFEGDTGWSFQHYGNAFIGQDGTESLPKIFVEGHEFAHAKFPPRFTIKGRIGFFSDTTQRQVLDLNQNTEPGHDSWDYEKHADLWGLKYLLYKEGIYDSRSNKDVTIEEIKKLREKYPNLRPFIQMTDEELKFQLNHIVYNKNKSTQNKYYA